MRHRLFKGLVITCLYALLGGTPRAAAQRGLMTPSFIIHRVATVYGERKPRLLHVEKSRTESSLHEVMYVIHLAGTFHRGRVQAHYLYFSALAGRWYVWGIQGYDSHHHLRWIDGTLRK